MQLPASYVALIFCKNGTTIRLRMRSKIQNPQQAIESYSRPKNRKSERVINKSINQSYPAPTLHRLIARRLRVRCAII
jgi:hypothetical protein